MQSRTIALLTAGLAVAGLGYLVYFDHKRRNDPNFRKKLRRERKLAAKAAKVSEEEKTKSIVNLVQTVLSAAATESYPTTPEEREKYFMVQVAAGEELCGKGEEFYNDAVLPFYKALKVYPAPMELLMIYQKTVPEPVFQVIVNIMALEQQAANPEGVHQQAPPEEIEIPIE
ncbi:hypothetical protein EC973_004594 [Apophysomyces ossiformis]|uniref:Mitochondrial import receptor subunit TOM20 n=1 Tax=Apophysomyces ossiformis TaxID=679940 RepID=A0A8H7BWZ8_9FUNG|nr:hypothetical protein EC973_004594 [Apophysomyces ossiformis]